MPARSTTTYARVGVSDIRSAVSRVREKKFASGVIALYDPIGWDGPAALELDGVRVAVIDTPTPLAMRNAVSFPVDDIDFTVLVTPLLDADLPEDVLSHLTPFHRVNIPVPADALRELFAANVLRPNIIRNRRDIAGVVDYLARRDGHPADLTPASAGVLTANHLHHQLLTVGASLPTPLTVSAVITWSLDPRSVQTWQDFVDSVSGEVLDRALDWLRIRLGESSGAVVRYLRAHGPRGLATWGLVAEVIAPGPGVDNSARASAEGAFRVSTGIGAVSTAELATWSNAVHAVFDPATRPAGMSDDLLKAAAKEAEQLIISPTGLDAADLLHRSRVCHGALDARIARLTDALDTWYADPAAGGVAEAWAAVRAHIGGQHDHPDVIVAAAVIRMIQWLRSAEKSSPTTLPEWLQHYRRELSWVDVCINRAWRDHSTTELARLSHRVLAEVRPRRAALDRDFAALAATTATERHTAGDTLLVEDVLDRIIAPLMVNPADDATHRPLLAIVLDGMSVPASNVLVENIINDPNSQWQEAVPGQETLSTALSVLPSVTEHSRTSLLSGMLASGGQQAETAGLSAWATTHLKNHAAGTVLLHKADLDQGIVDDVRARVEDTTRHKLVVAVLNTIDDALDKSDPIDRVWGIRDISHLHPLLRAAAKVGRTVVLVSDHGHVLERHETSPAPDGTGNARWRIPLTPAREDEVQVAGSRVLTDSHEAVLAVDEGVRYTMRKAGYHGGLSLAEVSVPVTVLSTSVPALAEQVPDFPLASGTAADRHPAWWTPRPGDSPASDAPEKPRKKAPVDEAPALFEAPDASSPAEEAVLPGLEKNTLFKSQVATHPVEGRNITDIAELIRRIIRNNGRLPVATFRETWQLGPIELRGVISTLLRILNMDGVQVLEQQDSDLVLNRSLLAEQFDVKDS